MVTTSPLTLNFPLLISISVLEYRLVTSWCRKVVLDICWPTWIGITFFLNSVGLPIPYKQETEATTKTSLLPDNKEEVVLNLKRSISSLIDKSF